ncbi:transport protein, putative [Perkinsus marinus ATCC 50983]|uniref:Lysosomal dipeptide transporter MFSD1 n=1 Tax=Perkinsus marinus (strain ATCC 50983 / TXsc) TaxID=423536 RepID=C5LZ16_PERM5|nr:transport protein, putative [Perkinsus marinus ATCC 50983]EEQ98025.1 transport protein, putative [Perkinsus marinus ATCC 50983]|eukprot:XP_002765308.1 transport protein, putative [Perkinsus marinus ATCC 50983]
MSTPDPPEKLRWAVLIVACLALSGQYYAYDIPSAINDQLQARFTGGGSGMTVEEYTYYFNLLYTVYALPNMVTPLILGVSIEWIGMRSMLLLLAVLLLLGQALQCVGSYYFSMRTMLLGRVIYGLGGESMNVAQTTLLAGWFRGQEIAFALGLNLSVARFGSVLNDLLSPGVEARYGVTGAFIAGLIAVTSTVILTLVLCYFTKHIDDDITSEEVPSQGFIENSSFFLSLQSSLSLSVDFWLVCLSCVLAYAVILPFNNIAAAFFVEVWYPTMDKAAAHVKILFGVSALGSPIAGICIDKLGYRLYFLLASFTMATLAHIILPILHPVISMTVLGLSYTVFASAVWPLVAAAVPPRKTGAAYGVTTAAQNFGLAITPVIVAHIRSSTGSYVAVEKFFFFIGTASIGVGILLWMRDSRSGGMLNSPVRSRGTEPLDPKLPIEGSSIETGPGSEEESTQEMSEDDRLLFNEHIVDG